jgi:hypothetical protein
MSLPVALRSTGPVARPLDAGDNKGRYPGAAAGYGTRMLPALGSTREHRGGCFVGLGRCFKQSTG